MARLPAQGVRDPGAQLNFDAIQKRLDALEAGAPLTSLPAAPVDGQEINYQSTGMAALGIAWRLRYRAGSVSAYKWEFLGGAPLSDEVTGTDSATSTSYAALATAGPTLTLPLAGDYDIFQHFAASTGSAGMIGAFMSYAVGATAALDGDAAFASVMSPGWAQSASRRRRKTGFTAGVVLASRYRVSSGTISISNRILEATPVRVG